MTDTSSRPTTSHDATGTALSPHGRGWGGSVLDLFRLDGQVALVTGASSGLGAGFARTLAEAGADVVLAARRTDKLETTAAAVRSQGRRALPISTDVCDQAACDEAAQRALAELGRLDILINNAGVNNVAPALHEPAAHFREIIEVNLVGAYRWPRRARG